MTREIWDGGLNTKRQLVIHIRAHGSTDGECSESCQFIRISRCSGLPSHATCEVFDKPLFRPFGGDAWLRCDKCNRFDEGKMP